MKHVPITFLNTKTHHFLRWVFVGVCVSILNFSYASALFDDPIGLDLYKTIDSGYKSYEMKFIEKELQTDEKWKISSNIGDILNKKTGTMCFKNTLQVKDLEKIAKEDAPFADFIENDCKINGAMSNDEVILFKKTFQDHYSQASESAQSKVNQIQRIGRIWLFTDGILENSPFDISKDIADINEILFEEEIPYNGVNQVRLWDVVDKALSGENPSEAAQKSSYIGPSTQTPSVGSTITNGNNYACNINDSWLSSESLLKIYGNNSHTPSSTSNTSSLLSQNTQNDSNYQKVNDNLWWPCTNFFCITIEYVTKDYNLLIGGKNLSIEGLLSRSNGHLKKFASTSLIPAKMTTNNFELGLKDLNLPDLFHVGVQITKKPVPILNLENTSSPKSESKDIFSQKNILKQRFQALWLEYDSINDLDKADKSLEQFITIQNSETLTNDDLVEKIKQLNTIDDEKFQNFSRQISTLVDQEVKSWEMNEFNREFSELSIFVASMKEYTGNLKSIIDGMNKIPISWS